MGCKGGRYM
jgi:hypothetical protein